MTAKELRKRNKELAKVGRRVCEDCGTNHELSAKHFYPQSSGRGFYYVCKRCWRFRENEKFAKRYRHDPEFRAVIVARTAHDHIKHRERYNRNMRSYRAQRKRQRIARILGVAS